MKAAEAQVDKLKADLLDRENFSKEQYMRADAAEERLNALKQELESLKSAAA